MHKSQVFGYLLMSFLVGVFVGPAFPSVMLATLFLVLMGTIVLVVSGYEKTFAKTKKAERNRQAGVLIGVCVLVVGLGVFRFGQANFRQSILSPFTNYQAGSKGIEVTLNGYVDDEVKVNGTKSQVIFRVTELEIPNNKIKANERVLILAQAYPEYKLGDKLSVVGALEKPQNFSDFDYVQYLKTKDVRVIVPYPKISTNDSLKLSISQKLKVSIYHRLFIIKDNFQSAINHSLPAPYSAYINGILLGARQDIPDSLSEAFNRTSTTHILAISGYNITIIAEVLLGVLVFWMRRRKAFWFSVLIIVLFTILTGASASVIRASVMGLVLLFANGYGRLYDPRNSILLAGSVMVFINPLSLHFDVGFQLSFLAVLGLMYIYPILEKRFIKIPKAGNLKETALMSLSAQLAVAPLLAYTFHSFSLVALPANLLVLPFMPYVMLLGFLTGLGGLVLVPLGRVIGYFAWALSVYQIKVIQFFAGLSFASVTITIGLFVLVVLYALIVFGVFRFRTKSA